MLYRRLLLIGLVIGFGGALLAACSAPPKPTSPAASDPGRTRGYSLQSGATKRRAPDAAAGDHFGIAVAQGGAYALVGADQGDGAVADAGAAYVLGRNQGGSGAWGGVAKLTASDGAAGDQFGSAVALDGDLATGGQFAVIGAPGNDGVASNAGAAYIFGASQGGTNNFGLVKKLVAPDGAADDQFGYAVAISGDVVLVSALGDDDKGTDAGAVYVFGQNQGATNNWGLIVKLTASDGAANAAFGRSVAISADTAIVGASGGSSLSGTTGAAYVFGRNQGGSNTWGQVAKIVGDDSTSGDLFGVSVAVSADVALVGALGDADAGLFSGAAYVFGRNTGGTDAWGQIKKLTASDADTDHHFGRSVALSGDVGMVGTYIPGGDGEAYLFGKDAGGADNWGQTKQLHAAAADFGNFFGQSVAVGTDVSIVGAPEDDDGANSAAGAAYLFSPANTPPVATDDAATTDQGTPTDIDVLSNDSDADGNPLTVTYVSQPSNGTALDNGDGTINYQPNPNFSGEDFFTYDVSDGLGGTDTARVTITVLGAGTQGGCDPVCSSDQVCFMATCYPACSDDADCSDPQSACYDGRCAPSACSGVDCASSEVCYQGTCYPACSEDADCSDPQSACYDGRCAPGPCDGVICASSEVCYEGTCYEACSEDADCSDPQSACYDGRCAPSACQGVTCPDAQVCYAGTCYEACSEDADCSDPQSACYDGRCATGPCDGVVCETSQVCYQGTCYEACSEDADCSDPQSACYDGRCATGPCDGVVCPNGQGCYEGSCYQSCSADADCTSPDATCQSATCVPADAASDASQQHKPRIIARGCSCSTGHTPDEVPAGLLLFVGAAAMLLIPRRRRG